MKHLTTLYINIYLMKHLTTFNELNGDTYRSAATKLKGMGHNARAKDLEDHSYHMDTKAAYERHGIGECTFHHDLFQDGIVGTFITFDEHMSLDWFKDGGHDFIYFPLFFKFDVKSYDDYIHQPFFIEYNMNTGEVGVGSEDPATLVLQSDDALLLNNRNDAHKIIRALRNFNWDEKIQEDPVFPAFKAGFELMVNKVSINQIWR